MNIGFGVIIYFGKTIFSVALTWSTGIIHKAENIAFKYLLSQSNTEGLYNDKSVNVSVVRRVRIKGHLW